MNRTLLVTLASLVLLASVAGPAAAHVTKTQGSYTIKIGWADEPAASGSRNHITMQVWQTDTEAGVSGLADALTVTMTHAGQSKTLAMTESDEAPGNYSAPILPTQAGLYTVHVSGKIDNATTVDQDFAVEAVTDGNADAFPAAGDTTAQIKDLQDRVSALEAKAKTTSSTPATVVSSSPVSKSVPALEAGAVVVGLAAVAVALALRRRK